MWRRRARCPPPERAGRIDGEGLTISGIFPAAPESGGRQGRRPGEVPRVGPRRASGGASQPRPQPRAGREARLSERKWTGQEIERGARRSGVSAEDHVTRRVGHAPHDYRRADGSAVTRRHLLRSRSVEDDVVAADESGDGVPRRDKRLQDEAQDAAGGATLAAPPGELDTAPPIAPATKPSDARVAEERVSDRSTSLKTAARASARTSATTATTSTSAPNSARRLRARSSPRLSRSDEAEQPAAARSATAVSMAVLRPHAAVRARRLISVLTVTVPDRATHSYGRLGLHEGRGASGLRRTQ